MARKNLRLAVIGLDFNNFSKLGVLHHVAAHFTYIVCSRIIIIIMHPVSHAKVGKSHTAALCFNVHQLVKFFQTLLDFLIQD
jgi:hypothetical protein